MGRRAVQLPEQAGVSGDAAKPLAVRVSTAAAMLEMSRSTVYELVRIGEIPSIRLGGSVRVPLAALERLVEEHSGGRGVATWQRNHHNEDWAPAGRRRLDQGARPAARPALAPAPKRRRAAKAEPVVDDRGVARRVEL